MKEMIDMIPTTYVTPQLDHIESVARTHIELRRQMGMEISQAHSETHLQNDAELADFIGELYYFTPRDRELSQVAAWFHDLIRNPTEDPTIGDDEASANEARRVLETFQTNGNFKTTEEERNAIHYAISNHGRSPEWLRQEDTKENTLETLRDKLWFSLFVADKIEANGARVIARRSSFVAGDRLKRSNGDWQNFGFHPDHDEALVVALESIIRLTFINPETVYPKKLIPVVHDLYEVQRDFVRGVCKDLNITIDDIASLLLNRSILMSRKIQSPESKEELIKQIEIISGITNQTIQDTPFDISESARETVQLFSSRYTDPLETVIESWNPSFEGAKQWKNMMEEYENGTWLKEKKSRLINI
jgi:hypothetical protein